MEEANRGAEEMKSLKQVGGLIEKYNLTYTLSEDKYAHFDLVTSNGMYFEVKNRRLSPEQFIKYENEGFIYELTKHLFLGNKYARYVNLFTINDITYLISWDTPNLGLTPNDFFIKSCRETTDFGRVEYVDKKVTLLRPVNAKSIYKLVGEDYIKLSYKDLINNLKK